MTYEKYVKACRQIGIPPLDLEKWERTQDPTGRAHADHHKRVKADRRAARHHVHATAERAEPCHERHGHDFAHAERGAEARKRTGRKITQAERLGMPGEHVDYDPHNDPTAAAREARKLAREIELGRHAPPETVESGSSAESEKHNERQLKKLRGKRK